MILYEKFRLIHDMSTYQTFHLKKKRHHMPSEIQVVRNSVKSKSKIIQETKKGTISDLSGLSWIVIEEYD